MFNKNIIICCLGLLLLSSCKDFLEVKPDQRLVVPEKLNDLQALLDNVFINTNPGIAEGASDNVYLTQVDFNALTSDRERNVYLWRNTANDGDAGIWQRCYNTILSANIVLETLASNQYLGQDAQVANLKGQALFHRSNQFFNLLLLFSKAYDVNTSATDLGIPLRLKSDVEQVNKRNTVEECYAQILKDLQEAATLLAPKGLVASRPDQVNTFALLSKVTLFKGEYIASKGYADQSLAIYQELIDYNTLNASSTAPFTQLNKETIFYATGVAQLLVPSRSRVDSNLYRQYATNDLRRSLFFTNLANGTQQFKGSYNGQNNAILFTGLTTAEVLLNRAEALARLGERDKAINDLRTLLVKRWRTGTLPALVAIDNDAALKLVLQERRKELLYRGVRWYDLKRLNKEAGLAITLKRVIGGQTYELIPNASAYVFPITQEVILRGGLIQN